MKVTFDDLRAFDIYEFLPEKLKNLKSGQNYCFYYSADYDNAKIVLLKDFVALDLNTSLYQNISQIIKEAGNSDVFLGYFKNTLDTRDGLFYLFLNAIAPQGKVQELYAYATAQDDVTELRISNSSSIEILNRDSFSSALAYFSNNDKLNTILSIYDIVNEYCESKKSNLYGGLIKKVVQLYTHDSGVLLEENGSVRYMVIGENANLNQEQKEKLVLAKSLLRSLENPKDIYVQTGWYLNINDGLWRTNISDTESSIDESLMVQINNDLKIYKPVYCPVSEDFLRANIKNEIAILNNGYNGKLSDILKHDRLYESYPQLENLPLIYAYKKGESTFYHNNSFGGGYINILGDKEKYHIQSILLHETQHAVQSIENFATGGNRHFANFVIALGGKNVRPIFSMISNFQKFVSERINTESLYNQFKYGVEQINALSPNSKDYKSKILSDLMPTYQKFVENAKSVGFYLVYLISDTRVFNEGAIIEFLERYYGFEIYDMFENIKNAIEKADSASEDLLDKGFSQEDVNIINFNQYQDLLGEMEARGTQHQMRIPINLTNYFFINEWEKSPTRSIAVIGGNYIVSDTSKIVGACEKAIDGKYILHFKKSQSAVPFIHELGHIVYDILKEEGFEEAIKNEYEKEIVSDDYQEYFVNVFLGYIYENYKDSVIGKDLAMEFSIKTNQVIFEILSNIFNPVPKDYSAVKQYLLELEKMI